MSQGVPIEFLKGVIDEVTRTDRLHPRSDTNTPADWFGIWMEEVVEACQAWNDRGRDRGVTAEQVRAELVQVAAMTSQLWASLLD